MISSWSWFCSSKRKTFEAFSESTLDDAVEDRVVEVGIVDADHLDLLAEALGELDAPSERAERLRAAVDADQDGVALGLVLLRAGA